jgi:hypothetical protein
MNCVSVGSKSTLFLAEDAVLLSICGHDSLHYLGPELIEGVLQAYAPVIAEIQDGAFVFEQ